MPRYRVLAAAFGCLASAVLAGHDAAAFTTDQCSFPTDLSGWTLNQNAFEADQSVIRLTDSVASETGTAFLTSPVTISATTFVHAHFGMQMGPNAAGGDGIAFVMHHDVATGEGASAVGTGELGYAGITPSVIVAFNTVKNGSIAAESVSLILNGSTTSMTAAAPFTMADAGEIYGWVDYSSGSISVYLSKTDTKPATATITKAVTLFTQLGSPASMFVGFTAATGTGTSINEHDVHFLELSTDGVPCTCEGDTACSGTTPACDANGICAICSATNSTACTGATPKCDVATNTCVGCLSNGDCSGSTPICDASSQKCRACTAADCTNPTPECATTGTNSGKCVVCTANANCPAGSPRCSSSNTCVQCLANSDCGGDTPICVANACVACRSDADCGGSTPACEVWGACGQCSSTNATKCTGGTAVCDFPTGTCVACEFNSDCAGATPTCDQSTKMCRACTDDDDCVGTTGGPACVTTGMKAGTCVTCTQNSDCTNPNTPVCDTTGNGCVQCLANSDCGALCTSAQLCVCNTSQGGDICAQCVSSADCTNPSLPVCDTTSSLCTQCANDYASTNPGPLSCPTAALPACQPGGSPFAGQCMVCSALDNTICSTEPATPDCVPDAAVCGCSEDTQCALGSYCNPNGTLPADAGSDAGGGGANGVCTTGCRVLDAGATNCATGDFCTVTDGGIGTCMGQPCNQNSDCTNSATPVCDTITQPHGCVACLNASDCKNGEVCDATNKCVQCTTNQTNACSASGPGDVCLANETCGCASDSDCGGPGRVCDPSTHVCENGCRASGGNGCPSGETCSSTNTNIGTCSGAATMPDAGNKRPPKDAGAKSDATAPSDGGPQGAAVSEATGCSCRAAPGAARSSETPFLAGGLFAGLVWTARRKRRARR